MSPKNLLLIKFGLTVLGSLGLAAPSVADPGASVPTARPANPVPSSAHAVLLLNDGRVLEGKTSETESAYVLDVKGSLLPVRKRDVQGVFGSIRQAYEAQSSQLPARDPDEQMKLAKWCLTNKMTDEAKTHLQAVLALSPKHGPATAMLQQIEFAAARIAQKDPAVMRTGGENAEAPPGELNPNDLRRKRLPQGIGGAVLPRIFDLPTPVAVKRAEEFARYAHPVLQTYCARCHNEQYAGEFQLIQMKTRHDRTPDALRANLDATLRLVDPENPSRSELLSSSLRPHGEGKVKRPIFTGSNDRGYQLLSTWVNSLRAPRSNDGVVQAGYAAPTSPSEGEGFAVGRRGRPEQAEEPPPSLPRSKGSTAHQRPPDQIPPARYVPGRGMVAEDHPPSEDEFPAPYSVGGPKPKLKPRPAGPDGNNPALPPADGDLPPLPEGAKPGKPVAPKKPSKPVKLDPALLERLLNRNSTR